MSDITFLPGPNLRIANNDSGMTAVLDELPPVQKRKQAPPDMPLSERLRQYSPTSGYARYTAMAADRIDDLTALNNRQGSEISRLKRILEERNSKVYALTIENEHRQVNETKLMMELLEASNRAKDAEFELEQASRRGLLATIYHYFRSK